MNLLLGFCLMAFVMLAVFQTPRPAQVTDCKELTSEFCSGIPLKTKQSPPIWVDILNVLATIILSIEFDFVDVVTLYLKLHC